MRRLAALAFIIAAMTDGASAQNEQTCRAGGFVPVIIFAPSTGLPSNLDNEQLARVVRNARYCRASKLDIAVYGNDLALAMARGRSIALRLETHHWPEGSIAITHKPAREAPSGNDSRGVWTAGATITFEDHDPRGAISPAYTRLNEPPEPYDPPNVYFAFNSAMLNEESRSDVIEGGNIFRSENYRLILLRGGASRNETNAAMLALARAAVVREALIQSGIDPSVIVVDPTPVLPNDAPYPEEPERLVAFDFSD